MAIAGLRFFGAQPPAPDFQDRAELAVEALTILDHVGDKEAAAASIRAEFDWLATTVDRPSETYVQLPFSEDFSPATMLGAIDNARYPKGRTYPTTYPLGENKHNFSRRLWFPSKPNREGYSLEDINRLDVVNPRQSEPAARAPHARVALADGPEASEPLLHLLGMPYDEMYADAGHTTQLEALAALQDEFAAQTEGSLELSAINLAGYAMIALQRRIEGKGKPMPAAWGFMRIPQLGRKTVDGCSIVGDVYSEGGRLELDWSFGDAYSDGGVGLSVGQNPLEAQTF